MRILVWLSIGFAASCALGVWLLGTGVLFMGAAAVAALLSLLYILRRRLKWLKLSSAVLLGLAFGSIWYTAYDMAVLLPLRDAEGQTVRLTITASDYSYDTGYGIGADGKTELGGRTYSLRFYLNEETDLQPGDTVTGQFTLRYTAPGGKEEATHHSGNGIFLLAYPEGEHTIATSEEIPWQYFPAAVRQRIRMLMEQLFPQDAAAFLKALLLGDTGDLAYSVNTDLSASGIRHVAAVSGLHVSILLTMVYLLFGRNRFVNLAVGVPLLLVFAALAGFSPSVIRACIMQALMLLALVADKEYDPPTALAFSALAMLVANPLVITSVGFQLSVGSVAGIFLFGGRITAWLMDPKRLGRFQKRKRLHRLCNGLASGIGVSVGATLLTTPLTALYFGTVNLLSVVTNLLCLWLITFVFCGAVCVCAVGAVWMGVGRALGWVLAWPVRYILGVAHAVAAIPLSTVYTVSVYIAAWLALCYGLLALFLLSKQKRPFVLLSCAVLGLCLALLASWTEPRLDSYRMTVLDVGQGQCILLQSGGRNYMVDCGGDSPENAADTAAQVLLSQGITRLDGMILTHYDQDHAGGAGYLLERIPAEVLILPAADAEGTGAQLAGQVDAQILWVEKQAQLLWDSGEIAVFGGEMGTDSNESSLCVLFHTEKCDILITGDRSTDGELALLREHTIPKLDVLVVGHHGSGSSTSYALLRMTEPAVAVISVGEDNRYGMPSQEVLEKLELYGCRVRRTDLEGSILIRG